MNTEVFAKVLSNYKAIYDRINDYNGRDEIYKWPAVKTCVDNWNLGAEDFTGMLKKSMSKSQNIIENRYKHPINGLIFLCEQGKAEEVRLEFRKLLSDNDDIAERQKNAESFIDNINSMLNDIAPSKWSFTQDRRDALMYLAFIDPAHNYMFKASCARLFSDYVEYGDDFGSGQSFKLDKYFHLCNEVLAELESDEEMKIMLDSELERRATKEGMDLDSMTSMPWKLRIVVYDIMYCADRCDLYDGIAKPVKKSSKEYKKKDKKKRIEELNKEIDSLDFQLEELTKVLPEMPNITNVIVSNIKFGKGTVVNQINNYVFVKFEKTEGDKQFALPECITKGYLKGVDDSVFRICEEILENVKNQKKISFDLNRLASELSSLE